MKSARYLLGLLRCRSARATALAAATSCLFLMGTVFPEAPAPTAKLNLGRAALQAGQYDAALQALDEYLATKPKDADEAHHLKAVALFHHGKYAEAAAAADHVIKEFRDSSWLRKAKFLKAQALLKQKKFQEAEALYEEEANRLLSEARKRDIAGVYTKFADALATKPDPDDVGAPPPNYGRAYNLYNKALELEISRDLKDQLMFKKARTIQQANNHQQAMTDFRAYLQEFDPDWTGPVGTPERSRNQKRENPPPAGKRRFEARHYLSEAQLRANQHQPARQNLEDLLQLLAAEKNPDEQLAADTGWLLVKTYRLPQPAAHELERAVKAARDFLKQHPRHPHAVDAAFRIAQSYQNHGRGDQAIEAYEAFVEGQGYDLPKGEAATARDEETHKSPAELKREWRMLAVYVIGQIRFQQKEYDRSIQGWKRYIAQFPNGPHWSASQEGIINAEFHIGLDAVAAKKYDEAGQHFDTFLQKHPLDHRARQILFTLGQIHYSEAQKLEEEKGPEKDIRAAYTKAVDEWSKLVSKYPNTEESSLALYRIGLIYEEKLGDLEKALDAYRRLTWGSKAGDARSRVTIMTQKSLALLTERKHRTNEPAKVKLTVRNIEKLTVKQYFLDLEAYFRKTHSIQGVERLDIDLIQPDKTWEVEIKDYAKYKPIQQEVEVPFEGTSPGVCIVNVSEEDWEATTLVVRSDLDLILKSSRRELLAFVVDMTKNAPASGVKLLLSDGKKVIATGETGKDGVFRKKMNELQSLNDLRVFGMRDGSIASNILGLSGLGFSRGLSPKGYLYTDRSAYRPGHKVSIRGIIREVKDGAYSAPKDVNYVVTVSDAQGRMLRQEDLKLSEFGTFHTELALDEGSPLGHYAVSARRKDNAGPTYSANFLVQKFKLEKMRLKFDFPQKVYFRGETVEGELLAEYYWGEPVVDKAVRYHLPDGQTFVEKPDAKGKLKLKFDTTGMAPGNFMRFHASIEGENVRASENVFLAQLGFNVAVSASQDLVMSGEPFEARVTTTGPDDKPVSKELTLFVLRTEPPELDPVLSAVPWVVPPALPSGEVTVSEHRIKTDAKTGKATVALKLEKGGDYILRVAGPDRFGQTVTGEGRVQVSDDEDQTKLRFFADQSTLQVGGKAEVRLHSRLAPALALLTYEGEEIISHQVSQVQKGYNKLAFDVGHEHFPNFRLAVSVMDQQELRTAAKEFKVERELKVTVKPLKDVLLPGEEGQVEISVTDQLGKPVRAELSLALVDEALFAVFPDNTPKMLDFFQSDAQRQAELRVVSTCGFKWQGLTKQVVKAYLEERDRLARLQQEAQNYGKARKASGKYADAIAEKAAAPALAAMPPETEERASLALRRAPEKKAKGGPGRALLERTKADLADFDGTPDDGLASAEGGGRAEPAARREMPDDVRWLPAIVTGDDGKAVVTIPMPEKTTQWRLTSRGCSAQTLVGETTANVITRKDFFVSVKAPGLLQEGDRVRVLARVHNLTDYEGAADLQLKLTGGKEPVVLTQKANLKKNGNTEVLFDAVVVPLAMQLEIEVSAKAPERGDALATSVPVRPWGLEYAGHDGGTAKDSTTIAIELPKGQEYSSVWMTVAVSPQIERMVIDLALRSPIGPMPLPVPRPSRPIPEPTPAPVKPDIIIIPPPPPTWGSFDGSELLAAAHGLAYAKAVGAPQAALDRLRERVRSLVSGIVVSQRGDGAWTWRGTKGNSDLFVTSMTYWALSEARNQGVPVDGNTVNRARGYLLNMFQKVAADDDNAKSVVLHALSTSKSADFGNANRLYRERNRLTPVALAYMALTFVNFERPEIAGELLDVLESKKKEEAVGVRKFCRWVGTGAHPWLNDEIETTAVALLALSKVRPDSPSVKMAVDFLLRHKGCYGYRSAKARGPIVASLATYYGKTQFAKADYRLAVSVNGKLLRTIETQGAQGTTLLSVPADLVKTGPNEVKFELEGRGEYAYAATIRGFSPGLKDPNSWQYPYVVGRHYRHAPIEYRGRPLSVASTSPVHKLEVGQRTNVLVDIRETNYNGYLVVEEPLPAGMLLVDGSLGGNFTHHEIHDSKIVMLYPPNQWVGDISYQLVGYSTGDYRILPTVLRDAINPGLMRVGKSAQLSVLAPGEESSDPYHMNDHESYALGTAYFSHGRYDEALKYLSDLFKRNRTYNEREVARMLLWIHTSEGYYDAKRIVEMFEVLRERYPDLFIPFDKILVVGRAYRDIGEFERAWLVFRATVDASFINDSNVSAVLQDEGQFLGSVDFQEELWQEYPDTPEVSSSYFALAQALYQQAPNAHLIAQRERQIAVKRGEKPDAPRPVPSKFKMLQDSIRLLSSFQTLYPTNPLCDDAAFSMTSAFLDLRDYVTVVKLADAFKARFAKSNFASSFQYMAALGYFWQKDYDRAAQSAEVVANGKSNDRDFARYILGQIFHAKGKPADAIRWYKTVEGRYPDAKEAVNYFEDKRFSMEEVTVFKPGEAVELKLKYRNIKESSFQIYRVDLMKLYLREKNLANIAKVNLSGIKPEVEEKLALGDGRDYKDQEKVVKLDLKEEGAYLVIGRGDDLFGSGMVLITPLKIEVQEDEVSGRVRANVIDAVEGGYRSNVHVKAIGSAQNAFRSGETDLRGIFAADGLHGKPTVIAREGDTRYAFYRGEKWLGPEQGRPQPQVRPVPVVPHRDYESNLRQQIQQMQQSQYQIFDQMRRGRAKGVQVKAAR